MSGGAELLSKSVLNCGDGMNLGSGIQWHGSVSLVNQQFNFCATKNNPFRPPPNQVVHDTDVVLSRLWSYHPLAQFIIDNTVDGLTFFVVRDNDVQAMSVNDERSIAALLTPDVVIINPFKDEHPTLFDTQSYKLGYTSVDVGQKVGTAEWSGKWKLDNKVFDLSGADVLTFAPDGKIRSIQVYVDPAQAEALVKALQ